MRLRPIRAQQAVPRRRHQNTRLAELKAQEHRGHGGDRSERQNPRSPSLVYVGESGRQRIRDVYQLSERNHPHQDRGGRHVENGTDHKGPDDATRHIARRVLTLLRGGRDGVESDIGKENQ